MDPSGRSRFTAKITESEQAIVFFFFLPFFLARSQSKRIGNELEDTWHPYTHSVTEEEHDERVYNDSSLCNDSLFYHFVLLILKN